MKIKLLKDLDKGNGLSVPAGRVIGVTNEQGAKYIKDGFGEATDEPYKDAYVAPGTEQTTKTSKTEPKNKKT